MESTQRKVIEHFVKAEYKRVEEEFGIDPMKLRPSILQTVLREIQGWVAIMAPRDGLFESIDVFKQVLCKPLAKLQQHGMEV